MVLYYGLLALEAANNAVATTVSMNNKSTTTDPKITSDRINVSRKQKYLPRSIGKVPSSSSSNSWIYTEDLRKHFKEHYADHQYVFIPVYLDRKTPVYSCSTIAIESKHDGNNSWIYSQALRDRLFHSTSKISLPLTKNTSSSVCCVVNYGFLPDELPIKKDLTTRLFRCSSLAREKSTTNMSLPLLPFSLFHSSITPFSTTNISLKHRTGDVVEEDDEEGVENENHSVPLIKHDSMIPSSLSTSYPTGMSPTSDNTVINRATNSERAFFPLTSLSTKSPTKYTSKLTRLRSFLFKSSSFSRSQQQQTALSSSSLSNPISRA